MYICIYRYRYRYRYIYVCIYIYILRYTCLYIYRHLGTDPASRNSTRIGSRRLDAAVTAEGCAGEKKGGTQSGAGYKLAVTRDCHYQSCMVYSMRKRGRERGVYCAVVVRYYCESVGITGEGGNTMMTGSFTKALKWRNLL